MVLLIDHESIARCTSPEAAHQEYQYQMDIKEQTVNAYEDLANLV